MIRRNPKFDKKKCLVCKYHGIGCGGFTVRKHNNMIHVFCDYATITKDTCLTKTTDGATIDRRGDDYDNCQLYDAGNVSRDRSQFYMKGSQA